MKEPQQDIQVLPAKTLLIRNKSSAWFGARYNLNLYRGCSHGCLYCDSRSLCYRNPDFDAVQAKKDALRILRDELARKVTTGDIVATGAMSDPYNPYEAGLLLTRRALALLEAYGFGAAVATKSDLICRDADVLGGIADAAPVICKLTITTDDDALAAKIEPRAPSPTRRFAALEQLAKAGLFCGVLLMPVLPFVQDDEAGVLRLVRRAADAGARFIHPAFGVTMRSGQREYLLRGLEVAFPGGGLARRYRGRYGNRYWCAAPNAAALWRSFAAACNERGILYEMRDIVQAARQGYGSGQLSLFGTEADG